MKFDVDDKNRRRLVYVKFHLNRCRFAVAVAECLGAHFFGDTVWFQILPTAAFPFSPSGFTISQTVYCYF